MKKISKAKMALARIGTISMALGMCAADSDGIGMWIALGMVLIGMAMIFPANQEWEEEEWEQEGNGQQMKSNT